MQIAFQCWGCTFTRRLKELGLSGVQLIYSRVCTITSRMLFVTPAAVAVIVRTCAQIPSHAFPCAQLFVAHHCTWLVSTVELFVDHFI
jgi:hypothetical protein